MAQIHLEQDFTASNTKCVTDIIDVRTDENWLCLRILLDLYAGFVVGWWVRLRQDRAPVILASDHGCQFTLEECPQFLTAHHITCSMSAVGSCADNAATESFFGVLKRERVSRRQCRTRVQARPDIFDCIERRHNLRQRRRLPVQQQGEQLLTQLPVEWGRATICRGEDRQKHPEA